MSARFALFVAALCAAVVGGVVIRARRGPELGLSARKLGQAAARSVGDDWDSLFI